jgi:hypothetical protein
MIIIIIIIKASIAASHLGYWTTKKNIKISSKIQFKNKNNRNLHSPHNFNDKTPLQRTLLNILKELIQA